MPESVVSFNSLPSEYQQAIQTAEEKYQIAISPLQELAGGWSGAVVYLVRVAESGSGKVQHLVLKLDRKHPKASSDEASRHLAVQEKSPPEFVQRHIPELAFPPIEIDNVLVIFYSIAGQSLHHFRTLSKFQRQTRLMTLFSETNHYLLDAWNQDRRFEQFDHPNELLKRWLGFRLNPDQKIEAFLKDTCRIHPEIPGFIVQGMILPNPLHYARIAESWGKVRAIDGLIGMQHSDLNTNNILAKFSRQGDQIEGYYLIDFAMLKEDMPLLYDQRYLEMSYLVHAIGKGSFTGAVDLILRLSEHDILTGDQVPIEMAGVNAAIRTGRDAFEQWVHANHPSLHDDLWGQYWLAGAAAGLGYCHKDGQPDEYRLAGLVYAAANLKQFFHLFGVPMPREASKLSLEEAGGEGFRQTAAAGTPLHNLPAVPTNFIGRKESLAAVSDLLGQSDVRLVTLTGPGGTGKTRLGLEIGRAVLDDFRHGVYFIDLAKVSDPALVVSTTAHTLGIREGGGQPALGSLTEALAAKEMLLIFDNFEQVTAAAEDIAQLLAAAPGVKALVTSRVPLKLRWEHEYPVSPLDMPPGGKPPLEELLEIESVALFRQQARAVQPNFEITEDNREAVVEICRRLDGLPLAIEIAAARVRMLNPKALLKRLDHSLNVLVGGPRDLPDRQQTLRQAIDWSYRLLAPDVQDIFIRLGVFAGGFNFDAAEAICEPMDGDQVFSGIESLLDNSLLRQVHSVSDEPRFDMLQTIREYAQEKAEEAGLLDDLRYAHCTYFAALMGSQMGADGFGADASIWLKRTEEDHNNYRAALAWGLDHPDRGMQPVMVILGQLVWFWYRQGYLREGSEWTQRALEIASAMDHSIPHAMALVGRGYLAMWSGDLKLSVELARKAVEICEELGFDEGLSMAKLGYGTSLINLGRDREAYPHLVDAVELYDQQGQVWMKGTSLVHLANVSLGMGNPEQALKWLDMAMPFMKQSSDIWSLAFALNNYGEIARTLGEYDKAEEYYRRTEALYKQADAKGDRARLVHTFGYIAQHKGDYDDARALFVQSLQDFRELGNHRGIAECLAGLAGLAAVQGEYEWAAPLLGAAEKQLEAFGGAWWPADRVEIERAREEIETALGDRFEEKWALGQSMGVDKAIAYALNGWEG